MHRALPAICLLVLLAAPALAQEEVIEQEPNDDPRNVTQEMLPGQTYVAKFQEKEDADHVAIVCDRETIVSFHWLFDKGVLPSSLSVGKISGSPRRSHDQRLFRVRLPVGRTVIRMKHWLKTEPGGYRLKTRVEKEDPSLETEPNQGRDQVIPLTLGAPVTAWYSSSWSDSDFFRVEIAERGIYRLRVERLEAPEAPEDDKSFAGRLRLKLVLKAGETKYIYAVDDLDETFEFFPILDPGTFDLQAAIRHGAVLAPYRVTLSRFDPSVSADTTEAARRAVDRGVRWLIPADQAGDKARYRIAAASMALMALCEGSGAEDLGEERAEKVSALVEYIGEAAKEPEGGVWNGEPLVEYGVRIYEHAFATLALAETAAQGSERARELCREGTRFLLASQVSERRPEAWKVEVSPGARGSWRYTPNVDEGDLSVTGWCLIALYAAAAADIEVEGLIPAAESGMDYVKVCGAATKGFKYQASSKGRPTAIRQSIGVLISELFGERFSGVRPAMKDLDNHLCAGTQGPSGSPYPFYYWYYATRANYLRGGYAWEAWRATVMEQLVRRQEEDGSWAGLHDEKDAGRRYSTGLAVMILRLCLGEPPHYMSREVRGF